MRILLINTVDVGGGAARIVSNLADGYRMRGHTVHLAVGQKRGHDDDALVLPNDAPPQAWARACGSAAGALARLAVKRRTGERLQAFVQQGLGHPRHWLETWQGKEDFAFPGTWRLLDLLPEPPDIAHAHNLHGDYFDLTALPWLSRRVPLILTLHDAWLLSGHCAHSFACERWTHGCGACPDLTIYPAIRRDATAHNWQRKRAIYARSQLYVTMPSAWLLHKVERSMLAPGIVEARVIPNGVDLAVFQPADRRRIRAALGIPNDAAVFLFTANNIRQNPFKDYHTLRAAVARIAERLADRQVLLVTLGEEAPTERIGGASVRSVPYENDSSSVAAYYQAADVYLHAARADTFPNTILEALACGTPVVATAVGGIPEQVKGTARGLPDASIQRLNGCDLKDATGVLVPPSDPEAMAEAAVGLLTDEPMRRLLGQNAAHDAQRRFDVNQQIEAYLNWYRTILTQVDRRRESTPDGALDR